MDLSGGVKMEKCEDISVHQSTSIAQEALNDQMDSMTTECMPGCLSLPMIVIITKHLTWHYFPAGPADYLVTGGLQGNSSIKKG